MAKHMGKQGSPETSMNMNSKPCRSWDRWDPHPGLILTSRSPTVSFNDVPSKLNLHLMFGFPDFSMTFPNVPIVYKAFPPGPVGPFVSYHGRA